MKKLILFLCVAALSIAGCNNDDSEPVTPPDGVQSQPNNDLYFYGSENSYYGRYIMRKPDGTDLNGTMHKSTTTFNHVINADLITHFKLYALNDCRMTIHLNQSNIIVEDGIKQGKVYELKFGTNSNGVAIVTELIEL